MPVQTGMCNPSYLAARRVTVPAWSFQSESKKDAGEQEEETSARGCVQPMRVQPQSQAMAENKAQPNCNDLVKKDRVANFVHLQFWWRLGYFTAVFRQCGRERERRWKRRNFLLPTGERIPSRGTLSPSPRGYGAW